MPTPPRILLLLNQLPQDPASGAARSMRTIAEFLAQSGMQVQALATTATEGHADLHARDILQPLNPQIETTPQSANIWRFTQNKIPYALLDTTPHTHRDWQKSRAPQLNQIFDQLFDQLLRDFRPDILFTFGGSAEETARRQRARTTGAKVVFGLRNLGYLQPNAFPHVDALLTGSQFLTDRYHSVLGIDSTPLPLPLDPAEVLAGHHEKIFLTYINPSIEKGVFFAARLLDELAARRPDIPIMTVESRGSAGTLVAAGLAGGFDLRRHENLMVSRTTARPADIFTVARAVIMPSVWEEPAGRVAAEALLNGIPPIVSNRGGLPEICGNGGFILPLPNNLTLETRIPVATEAIEPWLNLLQQLVDDEAFYQTACNRAKEAGKIYHHTELAPRYCAFFENILRTSKPQQH